MGLCSRESRERSNDPLSYRARVSPLPSRSLQDNGQPAGAAPSTTSAPKGVPAHINQPQQALAARVSRPDSAKNRHPF